MSNLPELAKGPTYANVPRLPRHCDGEVQYANVPHQASQYDDEEHYEDVSDKIDDVPSKEPNEEPSSAAIYSGLTGQAAIMDQHDYCELRIEPPKAAKPTIAKKKKKRSNMLRPPTVYVQLDVARPQGIYTTLFPEN